MKKVAYLVSTLATDAQISVFGIKNSVGLSGLAEGCVGVSLWFDTRKHAEEYLGEEGDKEIILSGTYEENLKKGTK